MRLATPSLPKPKRWMSFAPMCGIPSNAISTRARPQKSSGSILCGRKFWRAERKLTSRHERNEVATRFVGGRFGKALRHVGYETSRQIGSHIRLVTNQRGQHHVTVPNHHTIKIGTLSGILGDVAAHLAITRDELV